MHTCVHEPRGENKQQNTAMPQQSQEKISTFFSELCDFFLALLLIGLISYFTLWAIASMASRIAISAYNYIIKMNTSPALIINTRLLGLFAVSKRTTN